MSILNHNPQTTITWVNVSAQVANKKILSDCTGYALPGQMLAIMGPSGAGKTTLLSLIASKKPEGLIVKGDVKANGVNFNAREFYSFGCFVYQNDILFEAMTVRQCIQFTADLKLRGDQDYKNSKVDNMIQDLQLQKCQDTYIGGKFVKGISGGEKKRTCIAIQLISNPSVLILDEPTSGLDSFTAILILKILGKIAKKGKTVIFTIHQPSSRLFNLLDRLVLIHKGETIYQGKSNKIVDYLKNLQLEIPQNYNVSDFFMYEISDYKTQIEQKQSQFNHQYYNKALSSQVSQQITKLQQTSDQVGFPDKEPATGFIYQVGKIYSRNWLNTTRHPMQLRNRFFNIIISFILIGCIFYKGGQNHKPNNTDVYSYVYIQSYLFNVQGLLFVAITNIIMGGIFSIALLFPTQREVYAKQESSKTYIPISYYLSKILLQVPLGIIFPFLYASTVYYMLALNPSFQHFIVFALTIIAMHFTGNSLGIMLGCLFKDATRTSAMSSILILPLMMFSGLYSRLNTISIWVRWLQYISPFRYGLQSLLYNQFNGEVYISQQFGPVVVNQQLNITMTSYQNIAVLLAIAALFYTLGFIFLRTLQSKLAA